MEKVKLGDLCKPCAGQIKADADELIDYIDISSVDNENKIVTGYQTIAFGAAPSRARKAVAKGNILVSTVRPNLNAIALLAEDTPNISVASTGFCVLDCKDNVDNRFVFYYCRSERFIDDMVSQATGASYPAVSDKIVRSALVPNYSYKEQCQISDVLDKISYVINSRKKQLTALDNLIKSRFIEMFGDPTQNPHGWTKVTVKEAVKQGFIARPLDGNHGEKHPKGDDYVPEGIPFLMAKDLKDKRVDFENCHFITEEQASTLKKGWAKAGDVLITHKGTIGRVAIIQDSEYDDMLLTPQITYYRCLKNLDNEYLAAYFMTRFFMEQLENLTTGATRACVTITQQENLKLIIPSVSMQRKFVSFVRQTDKSKLAVQKSLDQLEILRKALMQQYFG